MLLLPEPLMPLTRRACVLTLANWPANVIDVMALAADTCVLPAPRIALRVLIFA
jgi:hypothetical protein